MPRGALRIAAAQPGPMKLPARDPSPAGRDHAGDRPPAGPRPRSGRAADPARFRPDVRGARCAPASAGGCPASPGCSPGSGWRGASRCSQCWRADRGCASSISRRRARPGRPPPASPRRWSRCGATRLLTSTGGAGGQIEPCPRWRWHTSRPTCRTVSRSRSRRRRPLSCGRRAPCSWSAPPTARRSGRLRGCRLPEALAGLPFIDDGRTPSRNIIVGEAIPERAAAHRAAPGGHRARRAWVGRHRLTVRIEEQYGFIVVDRARLEAAFGFFGLDPQEGDADVAARSAAAARADALRRQPEASVWVDVRNPGKVYCRAKG